MGPIGADPPEIQADDGLGPYKCAAKIGAQVYSARLTHHTRQHLNLIGYAISINSIALHEHRRRRQTTLAA